MTLCWKNHWNPPKTVKSHKTTLKRHENQPKPTNYHENNDILAWKPWKPTKNNEKPWNHLETNLNPWKPIKTDMEPWKTNLEPSKLTRSCTGWWWGVQVVTGDSEEEVIIFRDKQTCIIIYISSSLQPSYSSSQSTSDGEVQRWEILTSEIWSTGPLESACCLCDLSWSYFT